MITRDEFVKNVKTQIDEMNVEIAKIEHKAQLVKEEVKDKLQVRIKFLQAKRDTVVAKVQEIRYASEEAWAEHKKGTENVIFGLKNALKKTLSHFKRRESSLTPEKSAE